MNMKKLTDDYSVGEQISVKDAKALAKAGIKAVICNRPDNEGWGYDSSDKIAAALDEQGIAFFFNPVSHQGMTMENVTAQQAALDNAEGPVFAYCRSGQRSAFCWSFAQAGRRETDDIVNTMTRAGFPGDAMRGQIEALAGAGK